MIWSKYKHDPQSGMEEAVDLMRHRASIGEPGALEFLQGMVEKGLPGAAEAAASVTQKLEQDAAEKEAAAAAAYVAPSAIPQPDPGITGSVDVLSRQDPGQAFMDVAGHPNIAMQSALEATGEHGKAAGKALGSDSPFNPFSRSPLRGPLAAATYAAGALTGAGRADKRDALIEEAGDTDAARTASVVGSWTPLIMEAIATVTMPGTGPRAALPAAEKKVVNMAQKLLTDGGVMGRRAVAGPKQITGVAERLALPPSKAELDAVKLLTQGSSPLPQEAMNAIGDRGLLAVARQLAAKGELDSFNAVLNQLYQFAVERGLVRGIGL
jgi:hypothetical protein